MGQNLLSKSIWIFSVIVFLVFIAAIFPTPTMIGISISAISLLIIWQAIVILKDEA